MKYILPWLILLSLVISTVGNAGVLSWKLPVSYADGRSINPGDVQKIIVKVYSGPTKGGPWQWIATSLPGASSVMVIDPQPGHTLWYTARAILKGRESEYAAPISERAPLDLKWMAKQFIRNTRIPHARKIALVLIVIFIAASGFGIRWWKKMKKQG